jgi:hypothetical protein
MPTHRLRQLLLKSPFFETDLHLNSGYLASNKCVLQIPTLFSQNVNMSQTHDTLNAHAKQANGVRVKTFPP